MLKNLVIRIPIYFAYTFSCITLIGIYNIFLSLSTLDIIKNDSLESLTTQGITKTYPENQKDHLLASWLKMDELELLDSILNLFSDVLLKVLKPVQVNYSNEILANQIQVISILLLIITILISILIIILLLNILFLMNSDRLINYFKNKYIRGYLNFNKKFVGLEVIVLGLLILYFMYSMSIGILFIATHPITFT